MPAGGEFPADGGRRVDDRPAGKVGRGRCDGRTELPCKALAQAEAGTRTAAMAPRPIAPASRLPGRGGATMVRGPGQ